MSPCIRASFLIVVYIAVIRGEKKKIIDMSSSYVDTTIYLLTWNMAETLLLRSEGFVPCRLLSFPDDSHWCIVDLCLGASVDWFQEWTTRWTLTWHYKVDVLVELGVWSLVEPPVVRPGRCSSGDRQHRRELVVDSWGMPLKTHVCSQEGWPRSPWPSLTNFQCGVWRIFNIFLVFPHIPSKKKKEIMKICRGGGAYLPKHVKYM